MLDVLRARWRADMPFEELIELVGELDAMLHQIRSDRNVHTPVIRCPYCGHVGPAAEPDVSVRATILSLGRFGIAPAGPVKALEKAWGLTGNGTGSTSTGKRQIGRKLARRHVVTLMGGDAVNWTLAIPFGPRPIYGKPTYGELIGNSPTIPNHFRPTVALSTIDNAILR